MATQNYHKLKSLLSQARPGEPLTTARLLRLGISNDLAVYYGRTGWLTRLAPGIYALPNAPVELHASLAVLQEKVPGLHVGGKSALDWHGVRHYVVDRPQLHVYGWESARLPDWFTKRFPAVYKRKRLFEEDASRPLLVAKFESTPALASSPERAALELLSEVGINQPYDEAREILQAATQLRARKLQELLIRCTSIKTVRLCLQLGRELQLPWAAKLDPQFLPVGSASPWITKTRDGLLILK